MATDRDGKTKEIALGALSYVALFTIVSCGMTTDCCETMVVRVGVYLLPLLPLIRLASFGVRFPSKMRDTLTDAESDQEGSRVLKLTLAGFSLAAYFLLAIEAVKPESKADFSLPVYFTFVSFAAFLASYLVDSYRFSRWIAALSQDFVEIGRLTLMASSIAILLETKLPEPLKLSISAIAAVVWMTNFLIGWHLYSCFLSLRRPWSVLTPAVRLASATLVTPYPLIEWDRK